MNIFELIVVQPIFNLLILLYSVIPGADFGIALIIFTILIRFLMWPLIKKQLHQVKAMRKIQPELTRLRKKNKGDKQAQSMQMLELYKKHNINPFRSIGILLIQLPIFIALYNVIQIFTLHRENIGKFTYDFLENIPQIKLIIEQPDQFNEKLLGFIDLTQHAISNNGVNIMLVLLAVVAAVTQYFMSKQTMPQQESKKRLRDILAEAGEGKEPDQAEMNAVVMGKMMKFLPFMMFFIMLNLPAALALYYVVSNVVALIQQHIILKKDEDELMEIASEPSKKHPLQGTKTKERAKIAQEANVTRIVAKDGQNAKKKRATNKKG